MTTSEHFTNTESGMPTLPGRFVDVAAIEPIAILPGLTFRPVAGEAALVNFVAYEPNSHAPTHTHVEEQIVIVLEGQLELTIDGATRELTAGDVAVIPSWVPHGAATREETCLAVDIFSPPRATLLEHARAQISRSRIDT